MEGANGKMGIVGASGFIGGALAKQARNRGWKVVGFSRKPRSADALVGEWREWSGDPDVSGLAAVVNLSGESIAQRWTDRNREKFHSSRVGVTATLVDAILKADRAPRVLVNGSAVGIYGDRGDELLTEDSALGEGYLAELCVAWERATDPLGDQAVAVSCLRTGVVLGRGGEAWEKMRRVFSLGLGGRFGSGKQWMPWIHIDDLVGSILHAADKRLTGPINGSAPEPEQNEAFTRKLAAALGRPAFFHAPEWGLKLGLGEFGGALLASQRSQPAVLLESGYRFRYPSLETAMTELC